MTEDEQHMSETPERQSAPAPRKPRVALMGEFSAGKSTLTNLLLAADPLPVKITATRLPPVWLSHGEDGGLREDQEGSVHPLASGGLDAVNMDDTRLIRLSMQSDILNLCDLVDMPGISDPNMDSSVWRNVISEADMVIWCTHATQAWRQSEAAAFDSLPDALRKNAILLITRFDKLTSDRDRKRVMARVRAETRERFQGIYPVALLDALAAGQDRARWDRSGAEPFIKALLELIARMNAGDDSTPVSPSQATEPEPETPKVQPVRPIRPKAPVKITRRPEARRA